MMSITFINELSESAYIMANLFINIANSNSSKVTNNKSYNTTLHGVHLITDEEIAKLNMLLNTGCSQTLVKRKAIAEEYFSQNKTSNCMKW